MVYVHIYHSYIHHENIYLSFLHHTMWLGDSFLLTNMNEPDYTVKVLPLYCKASATVHGV